MPHRVVPFAAAQFEPLYGALTVVLPPATTHMPKAAVPAVIAVGVVAPLATAGMLVHVAPLSLLKPAHVAELVVLTLTIAPWRALVDS